MNISEDGDLMTFAALDEWGRTKINGLLEDGTRVIVVGVILKEVLDSFSLSDAILRDKTLAIADSLSLSDEVFRGKLIEILDSLGLSDQIVVPSRTLVITDSIGLSELLSLNKNLIVLDNATLSDTVLVNKIFEILDSIGFSDMVEKWVAGTVKTKIFLVIGDLAVQLTGE